MKKSAGFFALLLALAAAPVPSLGQEQPVPVPEPDQVSEAPAREDIAIALDGQPAELEEPVIMRDGRAFVPVRSLAALVGAEAEWNGEAKEVSIATNAGEILVFPIGKPWLSLDGAVYYMDVSAFLENGRAYVPLRHAAEFLHLKVEWRGEEGVIELTTVPPFYYTGLIDIEPIARQLDVELDLLLERNGLRSKEDIAPGTYLKIWIPDLMRHKLEPPAEPDVPAEPVIAYTEEELMLLAKLVQVEAGYEPYEGQVAVANVVVNRVRDSRFPDTIRGVIYHGSQFPPAHNGKLDRAVPSESAMRAAEAALHGENEAGEALYFYNPKVSGGRFWDSLTFVTQIGNHRFMK